MAPACGRLTWKVFPDGGEERVLFQEQQQVLEELLAVTQQLVDLVEAHPKGTLLDDGERSQMESGILRREHLASQLQQWDVAPLSKGERDWMDAKLSAIQALEPRMMERCLEIRQHIEKSIYHMNQSRGKLLGYQSASRTSLS